MSRRDKLQLKRITMSNVERKTISVCNKTRRSTWANGTPRHTDKGMKMVVEVSGTGSKRKSVTKFISA
jgi:hypothetical protein